MRFAPGVIALSFVALITNGCSFVNVDLRLLPIKYREVVVEKGSPLRKVLILDVDGAITSGNQSESPIFGTDDSTVTAVAEKLSQARKDRAIKAVVLRIDTPGGGVTASDIVYKMLKEYKEETKVPIYVSMMDMSTSGGYYIAMAADEIYAHPTTITGSIGVIAMFPQFEDLGKKIGVYFEVVKSGQNKDMGGGFKNMSPEARALMQKMIDDMYSRFVGVVAAGRPKLTEDRIRELADGRIYMAEDAVDNGLIDGIKYLDEVIDHAKVQTGSARARIVMYKKTSADSVETAYARTTISPNASSDGRTNVSVINVEAGKLTTPHAQPVFHYLWMP